MISNKYIEFYERNLIKPFRRNCKDTFKISFYGILNFIDRTDPLIKDIIKRFKDNGFVLEFIDASESISSIDIEYTVNGSREKICYNISELTSYIKISSETQIPLSGIIIMKALAKIIYQHKVLYKAVVLDLDDTLWPGTLSEIGTDTIIENLQSDYGKPFISFMSFIKCLAEEMGIYIAICSRNDSSEVEKTIEKLNEDIFPIKHQIDCIIANDNAKSENIKLISSQLSILPSAIVFIDDNHIVRDEVSDELPEVCVPDWNNHSELVTMFIAGCLFDRFELSLNSKNRRKQYKIIQSEKKKNRLPKLTIKINEDKDHIQSSKLYSKSNQFKLSINERLGNSAKSVFLEIFRENGDSLGICSVFTYDLDVDDCFHVLNWAISCRYFGIGLEEFILLSFIKFAHSKRIILHFNRTEMNLKVQELIQKYPSLFSKLSDSEYIELNVTEQNINELRNNTSLELV